MARKKNQSSEIPSQTHAPQVERYPGSDVIGMEYTTARPMSWETGADPAVLKPPSHWPKPYCFASTTSGRKKG